MQDMVRLGQGRLAMRAPHRPGSNNLIGGLCQWPSTAHAAQATRAWATARHLLRPVRLLALGGRQAGVVRRLRRRSKLCFQLRHPRRQCLDLSVPPGPLHVLIDSTGLQIYGAGQWLEAKHGMKSRRTWRKLHLAVDAASGMIVAQTLTDQDTDDPSQVGPLLDQIDDPIARVTADGAYDGVPTYQTIAAQGDGIDVVIPPRSTAVASGEPGPLSQRDRHLEMITEQGRLAWQAATDYGRRSSVETTMGRYKALIGPRLRARGFAAQQAEAAIGVTALNRMLLTGRPKSVRCQRVVA
jgi:hypothetical protein